MVGACFLGSVFTDNECVSDVGAAIVRDAVVGYGAECVGAFNPLFGRVIGVTTYTLAELPQLICIRFVPNGLVAGVTSQLSVFQDGASGHVHDRHGKGID